MADQSIRLIVTAKDAASKVLAGVKGNVQSMAGSLGSLRNLGFAGMFVAAGVAIYRAVAAIRRWRDEYVNAMVAAQQAEAKFQKEFRAAGKVDARLQLRLDEARIRAAAGEAGRGDTSKAAVEGRKGQTDAAVLKAKQASEAAEQAARMAALNDEAQGLLTAQAAADALVEKYKGVAGTAEYALEDRKSVV